MAPATLKQKRSNHSSSLSQRSLGRSNPKAPTLNKRLQNEGPSAPARPSQRAVRRASHACGHESQTDRRWLCPQRQAGWPRQQGLPRPPRPTPTPRLPALPPTASIPLARGLFLEPWGNSLLRALPSPCSWSGCLPSIRALHGLPSGLSSHKPHPAAFLPPSQWSRLLPASCLALYAPLGVSVGDSRATHTGSCPDRWHLLWCGSRSAQSKHRARA